MPHPPTISPSAVWPLEDVYIPSHHEATRGYPIDHAAGLQAQWLEAQGWRLGAASPMPRPAAAALRAAHRLWEAGAEPPIVQALFFYARAEGAMEVVKVPTSPAFQRAFSIHGLRAPAEGGPL